MAMHLSSTHPDLVTPDGKIITLERAYQKALISTVLIEKISPRFLGFSLSQREVFFNLKSTLAQLGVQTETKKINLSPIFHTAEVELEFLALSRTGSLLLEHLEIGTFVGKLFAAAQNRRVRKPYYIYKMFGKANREGKPLLSLGKKGDCSDLKLERLGEKVVAHLPLEPGTLSYDRSIEPMIPTIAKALKRPCAKIREFLYLTQIHNRSAIRKVRKGKLLLVKTAALHIQTVFARVAVELLPKGFKHTAASVLQPDTCASGDIYEFYGTSDEIIDSVPLEFYTLSSHKKHLSPYRQKSTV